ncbi:MAG: DUF2502 domain-containing protein [Zoogloea sp.]|nr:DUF2502 domain-containing protein [Zoogloea sp.]MCA0185270.1 DUF2502 domain-containing protein [Pseudomonadota bacterium]
MARLAADLDPRQSRPSAVGNPPRCGPPGVQLYIGDRARSGSYWDGRRWRGARWWNENCHRHRDRRDFRGRCGPDRRERRGPPPGHPHCPPGQAKKGLC